jgi:hypothetical protein
VQYTFIRNTNPFERLVTLLLFNDARAGSVSLEEYTFNVGKVRELLRQREPHVRQAVQLEDTMRALSTASIIETGKVRNQYRFSLPSLGRFYFGAANVEAAIVEALAEIKALTESWAWLKPAKDEPAGDAEA